MKKSLVLIVAAILMLSLFGCSDKKNADVDSYVTQKAMDGLFLMIAEEEKKLRANPMEAGSALLKNDFGAL